MRLAWFPGGRLRICSGEVQESDRREASGFILPGWAGEHGRKKVP